MFRFPLRAFSKAKILTSKELFALADLRVGQIKKCEELPESDKLFVSQVNVGEEKERQILSGLRQYVTLDWMTSKQKYVVFTNLKTRKLAGLPSVGMLLAAEKDEKVMPLTVDQSIPVGAKLHLEGENPDKEYLPNLSPKKMTKIIELFAVDEEGNFTFDGDKILCEGQPVKSTLPGGIVR